MCICIYVCVFTAPQPRLMLGQPPAQTDGKSKPTPN